MSGEVAKPTCATCVYWMPNPPDGRTGKSSKGECRRHAPQFIGDSVTWWFTKPEEWCGDHNDFVKWILDRPKQFTEQQGGSSCSSGSSAAPTITSSSTPSSPASPAPKKPTT